MKNKKTIICILLLVFIFSLIRKGKGYAEDDMESMPSSEQPPAIVQTEQSTDYTEINEDTDTSSQNGWYEEDGYHYYYIDGIIQVGWLELEDGKYYLDEDGHAITNDWIALDGARYYFDENGMMVTGWQIIDNIEYYFDGNGTTASGWRNFEGAWLFFDNTGIAAKGWRKFGSTWYYFDNTGEMAKGWRCFDGTWYYFDRTGIMAKGWRKFGSTWYYFNSVGIMSIGWNKIDGYWYYFDKEGRTYYGGWKWIGSRQYKFSSSGKMVGAWLNVPCTLQNPELPTGCESVALTNALNYYGYGLSKTTMASQYIARSQTDFVTAFHGNPFSQTGGMVCAPGIAIAADKYLKQKGSSMRGHEFTGYSLWALGYNFVANGRPVIIWTSIRYSLGGHIYKTQTYQGRTYFAHTLSHTVVLNGYDDEEEVVWISDSISGKVKMPYSTVNAVFIKHGKQAVVIY